MFWIVFAQSEEVIISKLFGSFFVTIYYCFTELFVAFILFDSGLIELGLGDGVQSRLGDYLASVEKLN